MGLPAVTLDARAVQEHLLAMDRHRDGLHKRCRTCDDAEVLGLGWQNGEIVPTNRGQSLCPKCSRRVIWIRTHLLKCRVE